jgi:hypothetical protein
MRKFLVALLLTLLPTGAYAACTAGDLTGNYLIYAHSAGANTVITTCTLKVFASGFMKKGTSCMDLEEGEPAATDVSIAKGKFTVNAQCRVKGFITLKDDEGSERVDILQATMSPNHEQIVGIMEANDLTYVEFTAVKK